MSLSKHELFQQMLEQINLHHQPEYLPYFESGEIEQVIVHKKSKLWSFQFVFDNVLPFEVFTALMNHMKIKFQSIATIDFQIKTRKPILTNESILDYWETVVQRSNISSPLVLSLFAKHTPVVLDNKVVISVENEITKNHLADNYLSIIQQNYMDK
ncbi:MAG TPA: PolC-type DNA polymerase III N-terminal domain-containing protein [Trichococcus flocculiformis]|nr:PolC-type DNA polymerase III N-terminal domain-containing protein [Trichococcus flocculiformis]